MKKRILEWLFKSYARKLQKDNIKLLKLQMEAFKETLDVKDVIRKRMKSVRPNHPDSDTVLANHLASLDDETRIAFLGKAKSVMDNETLKVVVLSLLVELQQKASLYSNDMVSVNFNRASINGVQLLEEELQNLTSLYHKENSERQKITPEESFEVI